MMSRIKEWGKKWGKKLWSKKKVGALVAGVIIVIGSPLACLFRVQQDNDKIDNLRDQNSELIQQNDDLRQENDHLSQENSDLREANDQSNNDLRETVNELTEENDALSQQNDALSQENDQLSQENSELTQENDALNQENSTLSQTNDDLRQENIEIRQQVDEASQPFVVQARNQAADYVSRARVWEPTDCCGPGNQEYNRYALDPELIRIRNFNPRTLTGVFSVRSEHGMRHDMRVDCNRTPRGIRSSELSCSFAMRRLPSVPPTYTMVHHAAGYYTTSHHR